MIGRLANALLSALLSPPCVICARVLDDPLHGAVCQGCWAAVECSGSPVRVTRGPLSALAAIGEYEGVLRDIVHALKYSSRRSVAPPLARLMAKQGADVLERADCVIPVPLHPKRERERGFNQADDLARGLGLRVVRLLRRTRITAPQVELPATARRRNVKDAFELAGRVESPLRLLHAQRRWPAWRGASPESALHGKIVVLVDDVTTTGATLESCARVLKKAGAHEVRAITAARVSSGRR